VTAHVHTAACYDREDDGHVSLACGFDGHVTIMNPPGDSAPPGHQNGEDDIPECDHVWSMGSCSTCGADCPEGCDGGSHSRDCYSYGRNEGHYTVETPCPVCNPKSRDDSDEDARADYEMDRRKDEDW
jgi:hypothetical protein